MPNNYPGERVGDSEVEIELELPKGAKPGEVTLTAVGPGGESDAVHAARRATTRRPSRRRSRTTGSTQAQVDPVPCAVEGDDQGRARRGRVQVRRARRATRCAIEVQAARFGSPVDALLTVYDADRRVVDSADDTQRLARPGADGDTPAGRDVLHHA